MPKRSLNLHENTYESEESDTEETDLTLEDYMEHPKTKEIILNQHFFDFEENMRHVLTYFYRKHAFLHSDHSYLNDKKMFNDQLFFNFIYYHIYKDYDTDFIKNNEMLQNIIFADIKKINVNHSKKTVIKNTLNTNSKKFDWATKTYK
jgi:hypothetical protein